MDARVTATILFCSVICAMPAGWCLVVGPRRYGCGLLGLSIGLFLLAVWL